MTGLALAFDSHKPGPDCDRFERHTHLADGAIFVPGHLPARYVTRGVLSAADALFADAATADGMSVAEAAALDARIHETNDHNRAQRMPTPNDQPAIADLVIDDLRERKRMGTEKYGTPLQAFNGRDPLVDAYQESIDQTQYLRQAIDERAALMAAVRRVTSQAEETIRDDVQGLCVFCGQGWTHEPGPRGGPGKSVHTNAHAGDCPFASLRELVARMA